MSQEITTAFVQSYKGNVIGLYQQKGAKLKGKVREESITGKQYYFERLGATAAVKRTTRHGDTPLVHSPHSRRMVTLVDYEWADLVDDQDKIRLLISPESEYAINAANALGRAYDDEVISAFDADAKAGEDGSTAVTFASEAAADLDFSAAAITVANMISLKRKLDDKDVDEDGRYIVISPAILDQMLRVTQVQSADYNTVKALVKGEINTFLGFEFIRTTRLPSPAVNMRYGFAWHRDSMGVAMGKDITTKIDVLPGKSYATQVYVCGTFSATRVQGEGVVRFKVDETK